MSATLPTQLLVDAAKKTAAADGLMMTFLQKGDPDSGSILLAFLDVRANESTLYRRERDWDSGAFVWMPVQGGKPLAPPECTSYIDRQTSRDPDLWVIEIEGCFAKNPFH